MKTQKIAIQTTILAFILLITMPAYSAMLFFEDFESGLSSWFGQNGGTHHGIIVDDPDPDQSDHALSFTHTNSGGDIFTTDSFQSLSGNYNLSFDYYRTNERANGFVGHSVSTPGIHSWIFGNGNYRTIEMDSPLNTWARFEIELTSITGIRVMLEDFALSVSTANAGDAFFDNILLTDGDDPPPVDPNAPVPEPATLALLGTGLIGMVLYGRKKNMFKN